MWTKKGHGGFDAAVWRGPIDLTAITVRLSMLLGLGLLWFLPVAWVLLSS